MFIFQLKNNSQSTEGKQIIDICAARDQSQRREQTSLLPLHTYLSRGSNAQRPVSSQSETLKFLTQQKEETTTHPLSDI